MNIEYEPEQPAQFALRIVEASGENVWYAAAVVEAEAVESTAREVAALANELDEGSAVAACVESHETFQRSVRASTSRIWIGYGFERFDAVAWSKLDANRSRLERAPTQALGVESTVVVLVLSAASYGVLQANAPNIASWIGGSVFELIPEPALSSQAREARLEELRLWGRKTDEEVVRQAADGTLPADPYYAEWLVLLGRGDLLGHA